MGYHINYYLKPYNGNATLLSNQYYEYNTTYTFPTKPTTTSNTGYRYCYYWLTQEEYQSAVAVDYSSTINLYRDDDPTDNKLNIIQDLHKYEPGDDFSFSYSDIGAVLNLYYVEFPVKSTVYCYLDKYLGTSSVPPSITIDYIYNSPLPKHKIFESNVPLGYKLKNPDSNIWYKKDTNEWVSSLSDLSGAPSIYIGYESIQYNINYYLINKNKETSLLQTLTYSYDGQYYYYDPTLTQQTSQGYKLMGWIDISLYDSTKTYIASENQLLEVTSENEYNFTETIIMTTTFGTSFSNLTTVDGTTFNLYCLEIPKRYLIKYRIYTNTIDNDNFRRTSASANDKWYYHESVNNFPLKALADVYTLQEEEYFVNNTPNSWFTYDNYENTTQINEFNYDSLQSVTLYGFIRKLQITINYYTVNKDKEISLSNTSTVIKDGKQTYRLIPTSNNTGYQYSQWIDSYDSLSKYFAFPDNSYSNGYRYCKILNEKTNFEVTDILQHPFHQSEYRIDFTNRHEGDILNYYSIEMPIGWRINYKMYTTPSQSQYSSLTTYYYYSDENPNLILDNIENLYPSIAAQYTYVNTSPNYWFTQNSQSDLTQQTNILSRTNGQNINLYGFLRYINYTVIYHYIDENNNELNNSSQSCVYGTSYTRPNKLEDKTYYYQALWYSDNHSSDLINQSYCQNYNENTSSMLIPWTGYAYNSSFSNLTTKDGDIIHYYSYYIPYSWKVEYSWSDNYGQNNSDFNPPSTQWHAYDREPETIIANIPDFQEYDVTGAGTKNWKYLDENNEEQINALTTIPKTSTQEYHFYTNKTPHGRIITVSSNNTNYGTVEIDGEIPEANTYTEGSTVTFRIKSITDGCHFHEWNDGNSELERTITVGGHDYDYIAQFHQNSDHAPGILGLYVGTQLVRGVYLGTQPIYKGVN